MTQLLIHYNGEWHIGRVGIFQDRGEAPVPAYYDAKTGGMICLWGQENFARDLDEPTVDDMNKYAKSVSKTLDLAGIK